MKLAPYQNLIVWQKALDLVVAVYALTGVFPREELYGLTTQMRRAAVSIPSNIAEGSRRGSKKDFRHFLRIAFSSGAELETQLLIVGRLPFGRELDYRAVEALLDEIMRMLNTMTKSINA